jgi:hypothetical protein
MELRVAFYLEANGFRVVEWSPQGVGGHLGEFAVEGASRRRVFVEVKSPGWEGELSDEERRGGRKAQPKYIDLEGRSVAPWRKVRYEVEKAYRKFHPHIPNLLVIADDLFVSLEDGTDLHIGQALYSDSKAEPGYFTDARYERLGGVGVFWVKSGRIWLSEYRRSHPDYQMRLFLNPNALSATALPSEMETVFRDEPAQSNVPLVGREPTAFEKWLPNPSKWKPTRWRRSA